ncbi:MAG: ComEC family competence protein [Sphingobacteriaceae bacterium]|nr:MAG: ComEC family competence protein [Sphingobacteriaceae bacterium]
MNARQFGAIPFVFILFLYLIGLAAGLNFAPFSFNSIFFILIALIVAFVLLNVLYKHLSIYKLNWTGGILLAIILIVAGINNVNSSKEVNDNDHFARHKADHLVLKIIDEPVLKNDSYRFTTQVIQTTNGDQSKQTIGKLLLSIKDTRASKLKYGDVLLIAAKYDEVMPPLNPAEFNYKQYLANKNIYHQAYLYPGQYVSLKSNEGNILIAYALKLRQQLVDKLHTHIINPDAAAVAATLILGYKADLSNDILQAYSKTGTIHVLSVSGAHVALVYAVLLVLLSFLTRYKHGRVIQAIVIILIIWFYALLTGFSLPVCRAAVMLSLILAGKTYSRYISTLNILAFSAFMMLLFNPLLINDVGFQLSYLAVAGLVILQPLINKRFTIKNKWGDKLWLLCSASIAAQVATLPLSVYYFHQIPVYFLISNLFILIPSAFIMYGGLLYLLMPESFILSKWLGFLLEKIILFTNKGLSVIEHSPFSVINKIWLTNIEYMLLYALIVLIFICLYKLQQKLIVTTVCLALILAFSISIKKYRLSHSTETVFLSLNKNNGIIFRDGNKAILITNLPTGSKGFSYSIKPYLDSTGVEHLDTVKPEANFKTSFFEKKKEIITFGERSFFIIDKATREFPEADIYYLAQNNKLVNAYLQKTKMMVIGAVSQQYAAILVQQAKASQLPYKILRRNKALILTSNMKK